MILKSEALEEFKQIYFEMYEVKLSDAEATKLAHDLINLFEVLFRKTGSDYIPKIELK